jgi:hypothetical protein
MMSEAEAISDLVRINLSSADSTPGCARRSQHAKDHGCVRAVVTIDDDVPDDLKIGLFAAPRSYEALIRFSNSREPDDRKPDVHGMAIKLLDVGGAKLVGTETAADILLIDSETFFTGDKLEYVLLNRGLIARNLSALGKLGAMLRLVLFHLGLLLRAQKVASRKPWSPLASPYFSATPYALGGQVVKYLAVPQAVGPGATPAGADGLSEAILRQLEQTPFTFDFGVDVQTDPATQPIDDPTVAWSAQPGARRAWLGRIDIPAQAVEPGAPLAENLAFSPWHTLAEHRPLGFINDARREVYLAMSRRRRELNGVDTAALPGGGDLS